MKDHEQLSDLLPALLDGRLAPAEAAELEAHLAGCDQCRAERRGLELLRAEPGEGLTAGERAALERGVMAGIAGEPEVATVVPFEPRRRFGARVAGTLGAAAVIALFATFVYFGISGGGDDDESGGESPARVEQESGGADFAEEDRAYENGDGGVDEEAGAAVGDTTAGTALAAPTPRFVVEDEPLTGADLQKRGESSLASVRFATAYRANSSVDDGRSLLEQLVDSAHAAAGPEVAEQVEECASQVLDTQDPTIPTFGSVGELDGREVLVLGFAWSRKSSGPLNRYMVWAWERGDCDVAVDFIDGKIETAN